MLKKYLLKFSVALATVMSLVSCSDEWLVPVLINKLDSYCGDFDFATVSIESAYAIYLTTFDPWYNLETKETNFPLSDCLVAIKAEKIRGPEKYFSSPDDMIVWLQCYYGEQEDIPVRVQYCLLDDMKTLVIVANNESGRMSPFWFRACWYSITEEEGVGILNATNETVATILNSSTECSSDDNEEETNQSDSAFNPDIEEESESRPIC